MEVFNANLNFLVLLKLVLHFSFDGNLDIEDSVDDDRNDCLHAHPVDVFNSSPNVRAWLW